MKLFIKFSLVLTIILAFSLSAFAQPQIKASLKADPVSFSGNCPAVIKFKGEISVKNISRPPLKVQYKFIRSDGAFAPIETLMFDKDGSKRVETTWTLGGKDLPSYSGWEAIKIVYPQDVESNKAEFKIECKAEAKKQDLKLKLIDCPRGAKAGQDLDAGFKVLAINEGDSGVKDIAVDIILRNDNSCAVPAPFAVYSPNYSNGVLLKGGREHVSIQPNSRTNVKLNGSNTIPSDTPSGKYYLCAVIDAGNKVKEANEKNNCDCCLLKILGKESK